MIVHTCDQRSAEWFALRTGRLTGSVAGDMLATLKGKGEPACKRDLRLRLALERLTGVPLEDGDGYVSPAMQRGIDKEAAAIAAYEAQTGNLVRRTGFITHDSLLAGCSLDGDVDDCTGVIEVKCPKAATHLSYVQYGGIPPAHLAQVTHNVWLTGAEWCDFVSYDDRFPSDLALFVVRVTRAALEPTVYELALRLFLSEVDAEVAAIDALRAAKAAA